MVSFHQKEMSSLAILLKQIEIPCNFTWTALETSKKPAKSTCVNLYGERKWLPSLNFGQEYHLKNTSHDCLMVHKRYMYTHANISISQIWVTYE